MSTSPNTETPPIKPVTDADEFSADVARDINEAIMVPEELRRSAQRVVGEIPSQNQPESEQPEDNTQHINTPSARRSNKLPIGAGVTAATALVAGIAAAPHLPGHESYTDSVSQQHAQEIAQQITPDAIREAINAHYDQEDEVGSFVVAQGEGAYEPALAVIQQLPGFEENKDTIKGVLLAATTPENIGTPQPGDVFGIFEVDINHDSKPEYVVVKNTDQLPLPPALDGEEP